MALQTPPLMPSPLKHSCHCEPRQIRIQTTLFLQMMEIHPRHSHPKTFDPKFSENHRLISLLSNIGKIFEQILLTRL